MTHSILGDLCKPPTLTTTTEKYVQLVHDATTELHEPVQSILSALDRRANALTKLANFESALRDAKVMQQLSSSSALGYLRAAIIYAEQGKQRHVIDICNQALDIVDTKDMGYDTLQRAKDVAMQRQSTRIDFVSQLPVDIVITTLIPMFMGDCIVCSYEPSPYLPVSHAWRDRIIQCFGEFTFHLSDGGDLSQVIDLAQHTKSLDIGEYGEGTWLSDLIRDNDFCALREIRVEYFLSKQVGCFISALTSIGSTLTHLQLHLEEGGPDLGVPEIMSACPNLITLKLVEPVDADMSSLPMATWPTLRTLHLYGARKDITCDEIIGIWKRFPSLKELELTSCIDLQSTRFVSEFCPSMKSLNIRMYVMGLKLTYTDDEENNNEVQGVTKLDIDTNDIPDEIVKDISSIIKQHHHTLEHLVWKTDTTHDTEYVGLFQYPRLRKLGLISSGWQIPRNAPLLEELMLTSRIISTQPQVLDMIPPHLNKLELKLEGPLQPVAKSSIERYLTRMSLQCQLKELVVRFNSEDDFTSIMDAIFRHGQLECLKISFTYAWDSDQMERFFHSLVKGCPRLSRLELKCSNAPSTYSITTLKGLAHLNMFAFSIYGSDGIDGFWDALRSFSQLRCLRIYPNAAIYKTNIAYLKEQRPDMKIINHPFDTTFEPSF